jgi:hypothetical protein
LEEEVSTLVLSIKLRKCIGDAYGAGEQSGKKAKKNTAIKEP